MCQTFPKFSEKTNFILTLCFLVFLYRVLTKYCWQAVYAAHRLHATCSVIRIVLALKPMWFRESFANTLGSKQFGSLTVNYATGRNHRVIYCLPGVTSCSRNHQARDCSVRFHSPVLCHNEILQNKLTDFVKVHFTGVAKILWWIAAVWSNKRFSKSLTASLFIFEYAFHLVGISETADQVSCEAPSCSLTFRHWCSTPNYDAN